MLEAYFFGEAAALERAGATRAAILDPTHHLEQLRSVDLQFVAPPDVPRHPGAGRSEPRTPRRT
jgi:hypothetical protein